jgi:hypothetical protein
MIFGALGAWKTSRISDNNSGEGQREEHLRAVEQLGTSLSIFSTERRELNEQLGHEPHRDGLT